MVISTPEVIFKSLKSTMLLNGSMIKIKIH